MVGGLFGGKAIAIGVAEADFQAVAHPVAGALGHRVRVAARLRFDASAATGRGSAALAIADVQR